MATPGVQAQSVTQVTGKLIGSAPLGLNRYDLQPVQKVLKVSPGTGEVGKGDIFFPGSYNVGAGASITLDMIGVLTDAFNDVVNAGEIITLYAESPRSNTGDILIGNADTAPFQGPLSAGATHRLRPDEWIKWDSKIGYVVDSGVNDNLKIENLGSADATFNIVVIARSTAAKPLNIDGVPGSGQVGVAYSFVPAVTGGSGTRIFSYTGILPPTLNFNTATGAVSGTPSAAGTYDDIYFTVTDETSSDTIGPFTIEIVGSVSGLDFSYPANSGLLVLLEDI